jgi:hypothetical protein
MEDEQVVEASAFFEVKAGDEFWARVAPLPADSGSL